MSLRMRKEAALQIADEAYAKACRLEKLGAGYSEEMQVALVGAQ